MEWDEKKIYEDYMNTSFLEMIKDEDAAGEAEKTGKYIAGLSKYMCGRDAAYYYNMPYLIRQHENFCAFLASAHKKYERLKELYQKIIDSKEICGLIPKDDFSPKQITIVLNEFLEVDLSGEIGFYDQLSMAGGEKKDREDMLLIVCGERGRQCRSVSLSQGEEAVIAVVKEMLERRKAKEEREAGGKADGNADE